MKCLAVLFLQVLLAVVAVVVQVVSSAASAQVGQGTTYLYIVYLYTQWKIC